MSSNREGSAKSRFRIVECVNGALRGAVASGVASYKGIPYGDSTAGRNRFLPPQPVEPWPGVRDALELGSQCPQVNLDYPVWLDPSEEAEDCLVLNVWTPDHASSTSKLPVMVWLHGGGYTFGSAGAPFYDGANIAFSGDVVVVGVNHRLNVFGYSFLGDSVPERFAASGNVGHLDLVEALRWISVNIAAFGGDPGNVTIFGQSGGGGKVVTLMAMRQAEGLFHKAIVMSGATPRLISPDEATAATRRLYQEMGIPEDDVEALQAVPARILAGVMRVSLEQPIGPSGLISALEYGPVQDGRTLATNGWSASAPEVSRNVPMMVGSTLHETVGLIGAMPGELDGKASDDEEFARQLARSAFTDRMSAHELVPLIARYREAMPSLSHKELLLRISTDIGIWNNVVQLASAKADQHGAPAFAYECAWPTPCFGGMWSIHGVELPFIFNRPYYDAAWDGEDSDEIRGAADPGGRRFVVGAQMFDAWVSFARTGDPSTEELIWPAYDTDTRPSMVFDASTAVVDDIRGELRPHVTALTRR